MTAAETTATPAVTENENMLDGFAGWTASSETPNINPRDKVILADLEDHGHELLTIDAWIDGGGRGASCLICGLEVEREGKVQRTCEPRARRMERIQADHARWPDLPMSEIIEKHDVLEGIRQRMVEGAFVPDNQGDSE